MVISKLDSIRKRWRKAAVGAALLLLVLCLGGDALTGGSALLGPAQPYQYSVLSWEVASFPKKWAYGFTRLFTKELSQAERIAEVRHYFALTDQLNQVGYRLGRARLGAEAASPESLARQRAELERERSALQRRVEVTLEQLLDAAMREEGLTRRFLLWDVTWPPVDLKLSRLPNVIALSPRERIELLTARLLTPHMSPAEVEAVRAQYTRRGLSSVIEDIGGVATYPSLVDGAASLQQTLQLAAHEWLHHYLFFQPLGQHYWDNGQLTAINETVADLAGVELGRRVYERYFATPEELRSAAPTTARPPSERDQPRFDFRQEMRTTRLEAERLLGLGKVDEAEAYMRERSTFLAGNGYVIPVLNQAYFAFHGSYTESAQSGSVNPLAGQIRGLRNASRSAGAFVKSVQKVTSEQDFLERLRG